MSPRDLSGFARPTSPEPATVVPLRAVPDEPEPTSDDAPETVVRRATTNQKKRITLSLPTPVADRLKEAAERYSRFYLDLILESFAALESHLQSEYDEITADAPVGLRPLRRRNGAGRSQIALVLPETDLAQIDEAAAGVGLERSAYLAFLLDRALPEEF